MSYFTVTGLTYLTDVNTNKHLQEKTVLGVSDKVQQNQQIQKRATRRLKFLIEEKEGMYYQLSKNKGADPQNCFAFAFCTYKSRFSRDAAQILFVSLYGHYMVIIIRINTSESDKQMAHQRGW